MTGSQRSRWIAIEPKTKDDFDAVLEYLIENGYITREQFEENKRRIREYEDITPGP
jgi:hypothetical protein